jgi:hypothetical protein
MTVDAVADTWESLRAALDALSVRITEAPDLATAADAYHESIELHARAVALQASNAREWLRRPR